MPQKPGSAEMKDKNNRTNMRAKIKKCIEQCIIPYIVENDMWPQELTIRCGKYYDVYVTKNARLVIRHTRTGLAMVYEAHTGDSYTLHEDKKTVKKTEAKEAHKPIERVRNATKDIHVANGWLPYEFKNNGLMVLQHVVGLPS